MALCWSRGISGRVETTDRAPAFVDGAACREPSSDAAALIARGATRLRMVPDDETAAAMRLMLRATHNLIGQISALGLLR